MLREGNIQTLNWVDKTMSVLRARQLEACEERLGKLPHYGLFGGCDDTHVEELWQLSYDAQEHPISYQLHTARQLQSQIMIQLPAEAALLSVQEEQLVDRLLSLGGTADLMDWDEMDAAESLVRRLWCTLTHEDDRIILHMPFELCTPLVLVMSSKAHQELRAKLHQYNARIRALLYLCGLIPDSEALSLLNDMALGDTFANNKTLALRYLKASFDCTYDRKGHMLLLHPGLAEPERLLRQHPVTCAQALQMGEETLVQASKGLLRQEEFLYDMIYGLLQDAVRPEITVEEAVEDLRMLAKQGVAQAEMDEVLSSLLLMKPTAAMLEGVRLLGQMTPRWGSQGAGMVQ